MAEITLYQLFGSPNSTKIRIALNYKGLEHEIVDTEFGDMERAQIVALSGQPLTPVLQHGDTVLCDSAAILRYLDCNFPDTPRLLFADRERAREVDNLEKWIRGELTGPIGMAFAQATSESPDLEACAEASERMHELSGEIERRLQSSDWLVGDRMSLCDVTAAPVVGLAMVPPSFAAMHPVAGFMSEHFRLGDDRERTRAWVGRVSAYDRLPAMQAE